MQIELEQRYCPICNKGFKVLKDSKQVYDCKYCEEVSGNRNLKDKFLCPTKTWRNTEKRLTEKEGSDMKKTKTKKERPQKKGTIKKPKEFESYCTGKEIEISISPIKENTTVEIEKSRKQKSTLVNTEENQQSVYSTYYENLKEERLDSVKLLNDTAKQLMGLATYLTRSKKDCDGEVIQNPPDHKIHDAVKIFSELRNVMNTKLGYLKLGKEIIDSRKDLDI